MADGRILSTHVLNVAQGVPAESVSVELWRLHPNDELVLRTEMGGDGRAVDSLLVPAAFTPGRYELRFAVGMDLRARGIGAEPPFHDIVPVRTFLADGQLHYHVPVLCSPWSYTTYRGS